MLRKADFDQPADGFGAAPNWPTQQEWPEDVQSDVEKYRIANSI
jgi:hypothetical protein